MLKRQDLAKQFELVVQQEIKNHNDVVLAGNIKVNNFRKELNEQKKLIDASNAKASSDVNRFDRDLKEVKDVMKDAVSNILSQLNDLSFELMKHIKKSEDWMSEISSRYVKKNAFNEHVEDVMSIKQSFSMHKKQSEESNEKEFSKIRKTMEDKIHEAINQSESRPCKNESIKRDFEKKLDSHVVDVSGIQRQLNINHKTCFIIEKKIENIYTLIDRLEKKVTA